MVRWPLQVVAVSNQKGGVGKTTTAVNLATTLALRGRSVCLIDADQQRNASTGLGLNLDEDRFKELPTILDIYSRKSPASDLVYRFPSEDGFAADRFDGRLGLIPGHRGVGTVFTKIEIGLVGQTADPTQGLSFEDAQEERLAFADRLRESLKSLDGVFDIVIIDTPPALDFILSTALRAANWLIIPLEASEYAKEGLRDLMATVEKVKRGNPSLKLLRAVMGKYDGRKNIQRDHLEDYQATFGEKMARAVITEGARVEELPTLGLGIYEHAPQSDQARLFNELAKEVEEEIEAYLERQRQRAKALTQPTLSDSPDSHGQAAVGE